MPEVVATGGGDVGLDQERRERLRVAALAGPGAVLDAPWGPAQRAGLLEELTGGGQVQRALAEAGHLDGRHRALPGAATVSVLLGLVLHSGEGYDSVLAKMAPHLRGGTVLPGQVPTASALSQARVRLGAQPMRALFRQCAARGASADQRGMGLYAMVVTAFDGTCVQLPREARLLERFGAPTGALRPQVRLVTLVTCGDRRIVAAAFGGYHTSEQELVDQLAGALAPGTVNLADRNFFSMLRWTRFGAGGAHLLWRVKNGARSLPARITERLADGSCLVRLRESDAMRAKRRTDLGDPGAERLTDQVARLIEFDVLVTDAQGRTRTSRIRVLTTLLDHEKYPAHELARLYAERWQVEITYLRLKSTLRGDGTVLRGRSVELVEQEIWALLVVYNLLCDLATAAAALEGIDPDEISFVAVLRLTRAKLGADLPCPHCHHHPDHTLETLVSTIAAIPRNRTGTNRSRISPRTTTDRRTRHSTVGTYTITIVESNLPTAD
jgi:hypothetical protein